MNGQDSALLGLIAINPSRFKLDRYWEERLDGDALAIARCLVDGDVLSPRIGEAAASMREWALPEAPLAASISELSETLELP